MHWLMHRRLSLPCIVRTSRKKVAQSYNYPINLLNGGEGEVQEKQKGKCEFVICLAECPKL